LFSPSLFRVRRDGRAGPVWVCSSSAVLLRNAV
jgi:hypothetical protein